MSSPKISFSIDPNCTLAKVETPERLIELTKLNEQIFKAMLYSIHQRAYKHGPACKDIFVKSSYHVEASQYLHALKGAYCGLSITNSADKAESLLTISLMDNNLSDTYEVFKLNVVLTSTHENILYQINEINIEANLELSFFHRVESQYILKLIDWISRTLNHFYYDNTPNAIYESALNDEAHKVQDPVGIWYHYPTPKVDIKLPMTC